MAGVWEIPGDSSPSTAGWSDDDVAQWRGILTHNRVEISLLAREAFLSALDEIVRLRTWLQEDQAAHAEEVTDLVRGSW